MPANKKAVSAHSASSESISQLILMLRGQKVLLDADLALLYGVDTRILVQAVKRNLGRFPDDFMFQLVNHEVAHLRSQIVISRRCGGRRLVARARPWLLRHGARP